MYWLNKYPGFGPAQGAGAGFVFCLQRRKCSARNSSFLEMNSLGEQRSQTLTPASKAEVTSDQIAEFVCVNDKHI